MSEEISCITKKEKVARNECGNYDFDFPRALFSVYYKLGQLFFHNYLLTFSKKDKSVLLTVMNI